MNGLSRRGVAGGALALGLTAPGTGAVAADALSAQDLNRGRVTVPVRINGQGPFTFAIDSAANASVIAEDLADRLGLIRGRVVGMHTLLARELVGTVTAGRVRTGALDVEDVTLALGSRLGLAGVDGLLGADLLHDLRLDLRFAGLQRARLTGSRRSGGGFLDVTGQSVRLIQFGERRFGGLLALEARASGVPVVAIIDTGALVSIANGPMARAAGLSPIVLNDGSDKSRVQSPTGRSAPAQAMMLPRLGLGGVTVTRLPILAGDFHTFRVWGLADRPAMLLGIDVLGLFQGVAIDLKRGEVAFEV